MPFSHQFDHPAWLADDQDFAWLRAARPQLTLKDMLRRSGFVSASTWDIDCFHALKVHAAVPIEFYPSDEELAQYEGLFQHSGADLLCEEFNLYAGVDPIFRGFFQVLINVLQAGSAESLSPATTTTSVTSGSTTTTQDGEEPQESDLRVSEEMLKLFLRLFTSTPDFYIKDRKVNIHVLSQPFRKGLRVCARKVAAATDGYVGLYDAFHKKKPVASAVPAFLEAKRHVHKQGNENVLAQVTAEVLSLVQYNATKRQLPYQEVFGIFIHHRRCYIASAVLSDNYLANFTLGDGPLEGDYLILKLTKEYDFGDPQERRQFAKLWMALLKYWRSGHAYVGSLRFVDEA